MGIPPTGKPVKMRFSDFWLFKESLLSENWVTTDNLDLDGKRQFGVDPLAQMRRKKEEVTI